jgi:AbrB family looped-hinge helix DNA binding protein
MEATLDKSGRIVIPKQVRDDLGLSPGSVLEIGERDGEIVLKPLIESQALLLDDGILVFTGEIEGDIETALRRDRDERSKRVVGPQ